MDKEIFKICHLKDNKIYKIDVFNGNELYKEQNITLLHKTEPTIFDNVFDTEEINNILTDNIIVFYHNIYIFIDDTIETIKKKIISVNNISFDEIYLYYSYINRLTSYQIFNDLTKNNKTILTKNLLLQFITNINKPELFDILPDKEAYDYSDILKLNIENIDLLINKPLGQNINMDAELYPITVNPYNSLIFSDEISLLSNLIKTNNKSLLLSNNVTKINKNIIYCCNANDVLEYFISQTILESDCIKLYYPYLMKLNILSLSELIKDSPMLISKSKELIDTSFERNYENVSLFNEIYRKRKSDLEYIEKGISKIEFVIKPLMRYNIPLDIIFKSIHADDVIPFIKFNPSKKMENIYRLYSNEISTKGIKIPYLNK